MSVCWGMCAKRRYLQLMLSKRPASASLRARAIGARLLLLVFTIMIWYSSEGVEHHNIWLDRKILLLNRTTQQIVQNSR